MVPDRVKFLITKRLKLRLMLHLSIYLKKNFSGKIVCETRSIQILLILCSERDFSSTKITLLSKLLCVIIFTRYPILI